MNCLYYVLLHCSRDLFRQSVDIWYCQSYNCVNLLGCLVLLTGLIFFKRTFWVAAVSESCLHMCFFCLFVLVFGDDCVYPDVWRFFLWFLFSVWRGDEIWSGDIGLCNLLSVDPERYFYIVFYTYFGVQESNAVVLVNFIHGCWLFRWPRNKSTLRSSIWQIFHQHVDGGLANVFGFKTLHEEFSCKTWRLGTNS